ncbi:MAG TPA: prolyl oligopeptidase family serine peptidase [Balneolaceae bacterium]|nr:prolyl oligopeptidase family serine peptidase [Balneolaceae bacterium]
MQVEKADIKDLQATGWKYPEPFKLKARDNKTDIYGVIFRPSNFSSDIDYPIVDDIYAGPQAVKTPKSFRRGLFNSEQPMAELGFILINVDGLGTAQRSKAFHDYSYKNLGDIGLPDHVKAIRELAQEYSYMDTSRVGIYGHSAGGYDAARAMFLRPNFFKVGVSESGDHDLRVAKAWWPELYMDYPTGPQYAKQSNMNPDLVDNLKGYLLLAHGDMDTNVHPAETYRLDKALIKAGKSFDMIIIPNVSHGYGYATPYFTVRRWNYFVEHLMGARPIRNYWLDGK